MFANDINAAITRTTKDVQRGRDEHIIPHVAIMNTIHDNRNNTSFSNLPFTEEMIDLISQLRNFDHTYDYSDDASVYRAGRDREAKLAERIKELFAPHHAERLVKNICSLQGTIRVLADINTDIAMGMLASILSDDNKDLISWMSNTNPQAEVVAYQGFLKQLETCLVAFDELYKIIDYDLAYQGMYAVGVSGLDQRVYRDAKLSAKEQNDRYWLEGINIPRDQQVKLDAWVYNNLPKVKALGESRYTTLFKVFSSSPWRIFTRNKLEVLALDLHGYKPLRIILNVEK